MAMQSNLVYVAALALLACMLLLVYPGNRSADSAVIHSVEALENRLNSFDRRYSSTISKLSDKSASVLDEEELVESDLGRLEVQVKELAGKVNGIDLSMLETLKKEVDELKAKLSACNCEASSTPVSTASSQSVDLSGDAIPPALRMFNSTGPPSQASTVKREVDPNVKQQYDGVSDAEHLGGSTQNDTMGQSPSLWTFLMKDIIVKSVVDVGCGRGISTKWFMDHGADVLCMEGSSDAISKSYLPKQKIVQHDFTLGPYWPEKTYDLAWSIEFLEHVGRQYMKNYLPIFHKSAILYVSHSLWGGHHHTEVHAEWWWIARMEAQGFVFSRALTDLFRAQSKGSRVDGFNAQHLWLTGLAFINPKVASLPEHAHLFGEPGCFAGRNVGNAMCTGADTLPDEFYPVLRTPTKWDSKYGALWNLPGAACREDYGFPTSHDGCKDMVAAEAKPTLLRRLRDVVW